MDSPIRPYDGPDLGVLNLRGNSVDQSQPQSQSQLLGFSLDNPDYSAIVDQIAQNNSWSAEQAQKQMDFQRELFAEANQFNHDEAALDRKYQQDSADLAMAFSSAEAEANRNWQKMMSDTAHRREMADLKAAGLNPILAANNGASSGSGATALSAQGAGYGASSVGAPSGAKGDTDESGTTAIASLLGRMLDNQTEIQKMIVSAETARETAEMYTGATRYAAELSQAASMYGSDTSYEIARLNPYNIGGNLLNELIDEARAFAPGLANAASNLSNKGIFKWLKDKIKETWADANAPASSHSSGKF